MNLTVEQIAEVRCRRDDIRSGKVATIPGEVALEQVKQVVARFNTNSPAMWYP